MTDILGKAERKTGETEQLVSARITKAIKFGDSQFGKTLRDDLVRILKLLKYSTISSNVQVYLGRLQKLDKNPSNQSLYTCHLYCDFSAFPIKTVCVSTS